MNTPMPSMHEQVLLSMLGNMEELSALYKIELDAIELRDMRRFADIQSDKNRLVQNCEIYLSDIKNNSSQMKLVSPALKDRIFLAEYNLRTLASRSQRACKICAESVKRVQERLLDAARQILMRDKTMYNKNGITDQPKNRPIATAINEAI